MNNEKEKEKSFSAKLGEFMAILFVTCIAVCLGACAVALTLRFISFLF